MTSHAETLEVPAFNANAGERIAAYIGRHLQAMVTPLAEHLVQNRRLSRTATAFLCSAAMWGVFGEDTAEGRVSDAGLAPTVTRESSGIEGHTVVNPVPVVNEECGNPGYAAPEEIQKTSMLCRFNNVRGVQLIEDPALEQAAEEKLDDIVECGDDFSHTPCDEDPFLHIEPGSAPWRVGEILARGAKVVKEPIQNYAVTGRVRAVFGAWKQSPTHWPLIKDEHFTQVGIGIRRVKSAVINGVVWRNVTYYAAEFLGH